MKISKYINTQKGVTIVELIIYIGLLSIFMLVLVDVFVSILNAKLESESTSALNQDARYIYSRLAYDVANADTMTLPAILGVSENTLKITTAGVTDTYSRDGSGNLNLTSGATTMKLNGADTALTNLSFTRIGTPLGKPTVKVSFTIKSLIILPTGDDMRTIDTTFGLRP
jgi:type II secretory pathway pseudopilin PulG